MFKSMSEILVPPRSAKPLAESAPSGAANLNFAEALQDAEEINTETTADTSFLGALLQGMLPRPAMPANAPGEVEATALAEGMAAPLIAGAQTDDTRPKEDAPTTGVTTESAAQMLAMIFGATPQVQPDPLWTEPTQMPLVAARNITTEGGANGDAPDHVAAMTPPPQLSTAEPTQALAVQPPAAAAAPLPSTAAPKWHETAESAHDRPDPTEADARRPADLVASKAQGRPIGTAPDLETKAEITPIGGALQVTDMDVQIKSDAMAVQNRPPTKVATRRHDEGATQFLWRQAMQADTAQPDQSDQPSAAQKTVESTPLPVAPQHDHETQNTDTPPATAADREDVAPVIAAASMPTAEPKAGSAQPDTPALSGMALGPVQTDGALRSHIHDSAGQHHVPATPVRQVVETLAAQPADVPGRIELTLTPETLGKVHFDMRPEGDSLSIVLSAERADTLDLMRRHLPDLMAELKQAGIQAGSFSFSSWNEGQRAQSSQLETPPLEATETPAAGPTPPIRPARAVSHLGGLDMRF